MSSNPYIERFLDIKKTLQAEKCTGGGPYIDDLIPLIASNILLAECITSVSESLKTNPLVTARIKRDDCDVVALANSDNGQHSRED